MRLQGGEVEKVNQFKCFGSTGQSIREFDKMIAGRVEWVEKSVRIDL